MTISDPTIIANIFNNYFTNVAQELLKKLGKKQQVSGLPEKSQ